MPAQLLPHDAPSPWDNGPILLDSSALVALCLDEPGADIVAEAIGRSAAVGMTTTNIAECSSKLLREGWEPHAIESFLQQLEITVIREDLSLGVLAGELHARSRSLGLSTDDAVCLAAALRDERPVLTADRAWGALDLGIPVLVIR